MTDLPLLFLLALFAAGDGSARGTETVHAYPAPSVTAGTGLRIMSSTFDPGHASATARFRLTGTLGEGEAAAPRTSAGPAPLCVDANSSTDDALFASSFEADGLPGASGSKRFCLAGGFRASATFRPASPQEGN